MKRAVHKAPFQNLLLDFSRFFIVSHSGSHSDIGKPQKEKSLSTSGRATKALPPPPLELNGHRNFFLLNFFLVLK